MKKNFFCNIYNRNNEKIEPCKLNDESIYHAIYDDLSDTIFLYEDGVVKYEELQRP